MINLCPDEKIAGKVDILIRNLKAGELFYKLKHNGHTLLPTHLSYNNESKILFAEFGDALITDCFDWDDDVLVVSRKFELKRQGKWKLFFEYRPETDSRPQWMIPSVVYHENRHGKGKFPTGGLEKGWSFREDRIPVPSCSILFDGKKNTAVWCNPAGDEKYISSVKTYLANEKPIFEITVPYTEEPFTYTDKGIASSGLKKRVEKFINLKKSEVPLMVERVFYCGYFGNTPPLRILRKIADHCEKAFADHPADISSSDIGTIASLKLKHLLFMVVDDGKTAGIQMGKGNGIFQGFFNYTTGSFLGKSVEAACIIARAGEELNRPEWICLSERIGNFFMKGLLPGGLHYDTFHLGKKQWAGYVSLAPDKRLTKGVNARCNGEVMLQYMRLYRVLLRNGITHDDYVEMAKDNLQFYVQNQLHDQYEGSYGRWRDKYGNVLNAEGTNGAYVISEIIEWMKMKGEDTHLTVSLMKAAGYYKMLVGKLSFYADTLDADCVDKEAGIALMRAFLDLYEYYRQDDFLGYAEKCACYILSWLWMYNVPFNPGSPAGKEQFRTKGMTAVSVGHHHLDFYGMYIAFDFLRLWEHGKDPFWKQQAMNMISACMQLVSSPGKLLNRSDKYMGWQPEQVNQTNWTYHHPVLGSKGKFHTCVAWNTVLTLGAMLEIRDRFPMIMNFSLSLL